MKKRITIARRHGPSSRVPATATTDAYPRQRYMVRSAYNRGAPGKVDETEEYLNDMGAEGWIFCGQITRTWLSGGQQHEERFDVFRREEVG